MTFEKVFSTDECPSYESLVDFYEGRLSEAALILVYRHLEVCSICDSELTKIHRCPPQNGLGELLRQCFETQREVLFKRPATNWSAIGKEDWLACGSSLCKLLVEHRGVGNRSPKNRRNLKFWNGLCRFRDFDR